MSDAPERIWATPDNGVDLDDCFNTYGHGTEYVRADLLLAVVEAERERCAAICDRQAENSKKRGLGDYIAHEIDAALIRSPRPA